jgi:CRISPR-associated protein Cmr5
MSLQKLIEQERAKAAWDAVTKFKNSHNKSDCESYSTMAKKFPMMALINGLGQALAFLRAKGKAEHRALYQDFSSWVSGQVYRQSDEKLLERLIGTEPGGSDSNTYRRATVETLAFAGWLKRFAEAELDDLSNNHNQPADENTAQEAN